MDEWQKIEWSHVELSMSRGHTILVTDTKLNDGWEFNMRSAKDIRQGTLPVEVQGEGLVRITERSSNEIVDFAAPEEPSGIQMSNVYLRSIVDPEHRDSNKVYNMLNAPQRGPLVQIPRRRWARACCNVKSIVLNRPSVTLTSAWRPHERGRTSWASR